MRDFVWSLELLRHCMVVNLLYGVRLAEGLDSLSSIVLVLIISVTVLSRNQTHYPLVTRTCSADADVIVEIWTLMSIPCGVL